DPGDGDDRGPRRHAVLEIGPARRRLVEGGARVVRCRMLDRQEKRLVVRRKARPRHLGAGWRPVEEFRNRAAGPDGIGSPHAVADADLRLRGALVGGDPHASLAVEREPVRAGGQTRRGNSRTIAAAPVDRPGEEEYLPAVLQRAVITRPALARRNELENMAV